MASMLSLPVNSGILTKRISHNSSSLDKNSLFPLNPIKQRPLDFDEAFNCLKEGTQFTSTIYIPLLDHCINTTSHSNSKSLHAHILKTGLNKDIYVATNLINTFMRCHDSEYAQKVFDQMPKRNIVMWTALISGYVRNKNPNNAINMFIKLLESGFNPVSYTFWAVLSACCESSDLKLGEQIHAHVIKSSEELENNVGGSLSNMYSKLGKLDSAVKVFEKLTIRDVVSWTTIINSCNNNYAPELGLKLFINMLNNGIRPNNVTISCVSNLLSSIEGRVLGPTKQFHAFCIKFGGNAIYYARITLMYLYTKFGQIKDAMKLFEDADSVNLVTINAMISGLNKRMSLGNDDLLVYSSGVDALKIFIKLNRSKTKPDMFTFSSVSTVCANLMALEEGTQIHAQIVKSGFLSDVVASCSLLNMYGKCGQIEDAKKVFDEMPEKTTVSCTSMITNYSQNGCYKQAIDMFEHMIENNIIPNLVSFIGVLSACSSAKLIDKSEYYFKLMKEEYEIEPGLSHYACMVDMFTRLGKLDYAFEFINKENFEPNEVIWSMLVASSRSLGNMDLAFYAADNLLNIKPEMAETYMLLLNMYKMSKKWQEVSRVRKIMRENDIKEIRDRSWITTKAKVHYFWANNYTSHPRKVEIYETLDNLHEKAKELGYIPYVNIEESDNEEDESEKMPKYHSEKMAVSFGLLSMRKGETIRVFKNISMCKDCHVFLKLVSVITGREIVVKDSRRLHKFKDGHCFCGFDSGAFV